MHGFSRDGDDVERKLIDKTIEPFLADLKGKGLQYRAFENGGLSNYYAVWVHETVPIEQLKGIAYFSADGITIYFSLLGPYAAYGHARSEIHSTWCAMDYLKPAKLLASCSATSKLEVGVAEAVARTPYQILSPSELNQRIPDDIRPYEYCLSPEPWNTVFHLLFANTD